MSVASLLDDDIATMGRRLRAGDYSSEMLIEAHLDAIAAHNPQLHAFLTVSAEAARTAARQADKDFATGIDRGPLQGIAVAIKDMIDIEGLPTTACSRVRQGHIAEKDAALVSALRAAGAILIGKTVTYEFAVIGPSFDLPWPPARNPWNLAHITGGSSSGSASAVAGRLVRTAIGTDTGGSIRSPACYCGAVGLKPTYDRVSRTGVFPLSESLDHMGPIGATVLDAALTLDAIAADREGVTSKLEHWGAAASRGPDLTGFTIAYARNFHVSDPTIDPVVMQALDDAASQFSLLGARIQEVDLPEYQLFEDCGAVILHAEAYAIHRADLQAHGELYGLLARQSLASGFAIDAADLALARSAQVFFRKAVDTVLQSAEAMLVANVLEGAPRFDAFDGKTPRWTAMRTLPFNVTGHPVLALPMGFSTTGLPLGMQIAGRHRDEATILQIGAAYEQSTVWSALRPGGAASPGHPR